VALSLRFDHHRYLASPEGKKNPGSRSFAKPYFYSAFAAYILGLATTMFVMHTFKAAQPALLYLSPACILSTIITSVVLGEWDQVMAFSDEDDSKKTEEDGKKKKSSTKKSSKSSSGKKAD
jgi:minor histocompatibility antigen H13